MSDSPWNSPGQKTGVSSLSRLQGIFPIPGSNPGLPHCRRILYQLSDQGARDSNPTFLTPEHMPFSPAVSVLTTYSKFHCRPLVSPGASLIAQLVKNPLAMQKTLVGFLGWEDPLEKG